MERHSIVSIASFHHVSPQEAWIPSKTEYTPGDLVCNLPQPIAAVCRLGELGTEAATGIGNSALDGIVDSLTDGIARLLRWVIIWWVKLPSPKLAAETGEPGPVLASIREYTSGLQVILMIAGILFAAARLAVAKRGGVAGEAQESFVMFARAVFASMMFSAVITLGTKAGDAFSSWVIFDVTRGDLDTAVARLVDYDLRTKSGLGTGVLLVVGILGIVSMLVQLVMLVMRQAVLILVVAAVPLAASAAGTGPGSQAYQRMLAWALAFVLWKPVGALVYAIAFSAAGGEGSQDSQLILLGLLLLLSVSVVLPALMRLIAPAVSTLGGGGGAAAALAGGAFGVGLGSLGGGRSNARKVGEGESSTSGGPGRGNGGGPVPPPAPSGGGGGGRPMPGGGTGDSGGNGARTGGSASPGGQSGAAKQAAGKQAAAGGAAAAGPVGAMVVAARGVKQAVQQTGSVLGSQFGDAAGSGGDANTPSPLEVRR